MNLTDLTPPSPWMAAKARENPSQPAFLLPPKWGKIFRQSKGLLNRFLNPWAKPAPVKKEDPGKSDQRTTHRFNVRAKVLAYPLRPQVSHQPILGDVKNLGKKGACIETPDPLSISHVILLDFNTPGKRRFQTAAKVVWCKDKVSGLEFLDPVGVETLLNSIKR